MLLTITYRGSRTQDLGFLLHKNPYRAQQFDLSYGKAYVFYPEVSDEKTTAALLLDINSISLAKGKLGRNSGGIFDYVNDRPYVTSSFMSTALTKVFGTAMCGRCDKLPELVNQDLDLEAKIHMLPCKGDAELARELFEPLGYKVEYETHILDEKFPEWGDSLYIDLTISGSLKLAELLNHLYVLIPVFDKQKHYWVNREEIDKLLKHGEGWLSEHPERKRIVSRYFSRKRSFANSAIDILLANEEAIEEEAESLDETDATNATNETNDTNATETNESDAKAQVAPILSLNMQRMNAVYQELVDIGATKVLDLGCGDCRLTDRLLLSAQFTEVCAADVSMEALEKAKKRLHFDRMPPYKKNKLTMMQASITYKDSRFEGFDAICLVEVIEHLDLPRLKAAERVIFEFAAPRTVIVTTPNKEYNAVYEWMNTELRHNDHRFEWSRKEFEAWAKAVCEKFGYTVEIKEIGEATEDVGASTQMGVFTKCV